MMLPKDKKQTKKEKKKFAEMSLNMDIDDGAQPWKSGEQPGTNSVQPRSEEEYNGEPSEEEKNTEEKHVLFGAVV